DPVSENPVRKGQQTRAVHPARIRHQQGRIPTQDRAKTVQLFLHPTTIPAPPRPRNAISPRFPGPSLAAGPSIAPFHAKKRLHSAARPVVSGVGGKRSKMADVANK